MPIHMTFVHSCLELLKSRLINTGGNGKASRLGLRLFREELSLGRGLYCLGKRLPCLPRTLLLSLLEAP